MIEGAPPRPHSRLLQNIAFALVSLSFAIVGVYGAGMLGAKSELFGYSQHRSTGASFEVLLWIVASLLVFVLFMPLVYALRLQRLAAASRFRGYLIALAPIAVPLGLLGIGGNRFLLLAALLVTALSIAYFECMRWVDADVWRTVPAIAAASVAAYVLQLALQ